jgi:hypothetical protein
VTTIKKTIGAGRKKPAPKTSPEAETVAASSSEAEQPLLVGEFIGKGEAPAASEDAASVEAEVEKKDEEVVERVEHLSHSVGWLLVSAGVVGLILPGIIGTPFLIMGGLALWPGNRKTVERWRKGHSPKMFHGSMRQINRFLDDLEKRYPHSRIDKK